MTKDFAITMQDGTGRFVTLYITGASIDEMIATGMPEWLAVEENQNNAFGNAIARGEIGEDAWLV